jgi:hypothetical protein
MIFDKIDNVRDVGVICHYYGIKGPGTYQDPGLYTLPARSFNVLVISELIL